MVLNIQNVHENSFYLEVMLLRYFQTDLTDALASVAHVWIRPRSTTNLSHLFIGDTSLTQSQQPLTKHYVTHKMNYCTKIKETKNNPIFSIRFNDNKKYITQILYIHCYIIEKDPTLRIL